MPTYQPYTKVADLEPNNQGDRTILEAHLDQNHAVIVDVLERLAMAVFEEGGVVVPGTVTNPSGAQVRVQGRMGVSKDGKTLLAVGDATVDLASVPIGTKCLVVIRALPGATVNHNFTDATTGESLTHTLMSAWGSLAVLEGDTSDYPELPDDCVPVAQVTKTGSSTLSLDEVETAAPIVRYSGGGGGGGAFTDLTDAPSSYSGAGGKVVAVKEDESGLELVDAPTGVVPYDFNLGFAGSPDAGAADAVLVPRAVVIDDAGPGEVYVGSNPTSDPAVIDIQVNWNSVGSIEIEDDGTVTWVLTADIELEPGDVLALVAPSPADATLADLIVAFNGIAS